MRLLTIGFSILLLVICDVTFLDSSKASTYPDCSSPDKEPSMGQCAYRDFKAAQDNLTLVEQRLAKRLSRSTLIIKLLKIDEQDWSNYMEIKCSNKEIGIEDAVDGTDANSRASCKIDLMKLRSKELEMLR